MWLDGRYLCYSPGSVISALQRFPRLTQQLDSGSSAEFSSSDDVGVESLVRQRWTGWVTAGHEEMQVSFSSLNSALFLEAMGGVQDPRGSGDCGHSFDSFGQFRDPAGPAGESSVGHMFCRGVLCFYY